jgi:protein-S-isoprenylcysteine O-methyltransferase Ste14
VKALELKVPPALWVLLCGGLMWMVDQLLPQFQQDWLWHQWAAITIFVVAVLLIATGAISFRLAKPQLIPPSQKRHLLWSQLGFIDTPETPCTSGFY